MTGQLQANAQALLDVTIASLAVQNPSSNSSARPVASRVVLVVVAEASGCAAQIPCATQPLLKVVDQNGDLVANLGNEAHPWVVVATLSTSLNPNASLILQTEADIVNGYAAFERLGISHLTTFSLSFKFSTPTGVDGAGFDPQEQETSSITSRLPVLACQQYDDEIVVSANADFSITVKIVDKISKVQVEDLNAAVGAVSRINMFTEVGISGNFGYQPYLRIRHQKRLRPSPKQCQINFFLNKKL